MARQKIKKHTHKFLLFFLFFFFVPHFFLFFRKKLFFLHTLKIQMRMEIAPLLGPTFTMRSNGTDSKRRAIASDKQKLIDSYVKNNRQSSAFTSGSTITTAVAMQQQPSASRKRPLDTAFVAQQQQHLPTPKRECGCCALVEDDYIADRFVLAAKALGKGSSGTAYLVQYDRGSFSPPNSMVLKHIEGAPAEDAAQEATLHRKLIHPNVVRLLDAFLSIELSESGAPKQAWMLLEAAHGGTLFQRLHEMPQWGTENARRTMSGLLSALAYCHQRGVVHWDVSSTNVLLAADGTVRLADFGLSVECRIAKDGAPQPMVVRGAITALYYRAPESLLTTLYRRRVPQGTPHLLHGAPADVWSAACVFAELCGAFQLLRMHDKEQAHLENVLAVARYGEAAQWVAANPYLVAHARARLMSVSSDGRMRARGLATISDAVGADGAELVCAMLRLDPERRLSAAKALQHRWFSTLNSG